MLFRSWQSGLCIFMAERHLYRSIIGNIVPKNWSLRTRDALYNVGVGPRIQHYRIGIDFLIQYTSYVTNSTSSSSRSSLIGWETVAFVLVHRGGDISPPTMWGGNKETRKEQKYDRKRFCLGNTLCSWFIFRSAGLLCPSTIRCTANGEIYSAWIGKYSNRTGILTTLPIDSNKPPSFTHLLTTA
jgi:hypothetical protein